MKQGAGCWGTDSSGFEEEAHLWLIGPAAAPFRHLLQSGGFV